MEVKYNEYRDGGIDDKKSFFTTLFDDVSDKAELFYNALERECEQFFKLSSYVHKFNGNVFEMAMIDTIEDIKRLSDFHSIKNPSKIKYAAYLGYWLLKRKPFQYLNADLILEMKNSLTPRKLQMEIMNINEYFVLYLILSMVFNKESEICAANMQTNKRRWSNAEGYLFYFLCYRVSSAKSIEAFLVTSTLHPIWDLTENVNYDVDGFK